MATRSRTSSQKRQRELARQEKRRDKAEKKAQRKLSGPQTPEIEDIPELVDMRGELDYDIDETEVGSGAAAK